MPAKASRAAFGEALLDLAARDARIVTVDADLSKSTMTAKFAKAHPDRAFNVGIAESNMIGIGPFVTIPAFLAAMGGPQALIGWVLGALLVVCDSMVWAELGAALPGSGGSYHFLNQIYGRYRFGDIVPFLFIWQFLVSGPLEMASAYIGFVQYLDYAAPEVRAAIDAARAVLEAPRGPEAAVP